MAPTSDQVDTSDLAQILTEPRAFTALFDAIPFQIVVKSLRTQNFGEILIWNRAAEKGLGIRAADAVGRDEWAFFTPAQASFFREKDIEAMRRRETVVIPSEPVTTRDGKIRYMRTTKTPIFDSEGEPAVLFAVSEDITDRRAKETQRVQALELIDNVARNISGAIYQFGVDSRGRLVLAYVSGGFRELYGLQSNDNRESFDTIFRIVVDEDRGPVEEGLRAAVANGAEWSDEWRILPPGAEEIRWIRATASPKRQPDGRIIWYGSMWDVSDLKRAELERERAREFVENVNRELPGAVFQLRVESGGQATFPYVSEGIRLLTGDRADEFMADTVSLFARIEPVDLPGFLSEITNSRDEKRTLRAEFRVRTADGEMRWAFANATPVDEPDGSTIWSGFISDLSDRKRIERQLIVAKESAEHASQAKSEFLAMMSHEIRTPLNAMLGFSDLLAGTDLDAEQADYLRTVREASASLLVVLNDILDYSKIESGSLDLSPGPCDVRRLVHTAVDVFRPQAAGKSLLLEVSVSPDVPQTVVIDAARLNQILHNLLSNAVKLTERGGIVVSVSLNPEELRPYLRVGPGVVPLTFEVNDTGIGIDLTEHKSLFEPFYQADSTMQRRHGGTGLGLAIVRRLVSLMDGGIILESGTGLGTSFVISVPVREPNAEEVSHSADKPKTVNLSGLLRRILIVEDNHANRQLVKLFLRKLGFEADEAASGSEGVRLALRNDYDVILMDLEMPGMDGCEAARRILAREDGKLPRIIALTAHAMPEYRESSMTAGMQDYLCKPIKQSDLSRVLRDAFGG